MSDFINNIRGAKIYKDITKNEKLCLEEGESLRLNVLSIGNSLHKGEVHYYVTSERDDGSLQVYVLPRGYDNWVKGVMDIARTQKLFPALVDFGLFECVYTADIL